MVFVSCGGSGYAGWTNRTPESCSPRSAERSTDTSPYARPEHQRPEMNERNSRDVSEELVGPTQFRKLESAISWYAYLRNT
jgi:hypothetical protein